MLESHHDISIAEEVQQDMDKKSVRKQLRNEILGVEGFHVGLGGTFHNSWVLMNPQSEELNFLGDNINYRFDYGYSYGLSLGYDFSPEFGVQTGFTITSKQGQRFSHELNGQRINSEIDMTYMRIPMFFKYKWSRMSSLTQKPVVLNSLFGIQLNRMRSATVYNGGEKLRGESKFSSTDLGVVMGLSYDIFVSDKYYITVGARGSLSSDIRSFPALFSSERDKAEKALLGVTLSVNRLFPTKNHDN